VPLTFSSDVFLSKNDNSGGKTREAFEEVEYDFYFMEYDFCPNGLIICQQYFTCMWFLGFIRYNKTFIACRFRKYENLFTHEYHIPLWHESKSPVVLWELLLS
jgi:hypothetical protein